MKFSLLGVLLALSCGSFGKNDWMKACLNGTCSFDVAESVTSMGGTIEISGTPSAISDITSAAGWHVANCTDSTNNQTIQLICVDESMGCAHIFQDGAQDTIIRLPENCGSGPFVRVANHWIPDDQSVPSTMAFDTTIRTRSIPQVHTLEIDDDFNKISGLHGNVSFDIRAQGDLHSGSKQNKRQNGSGLEAASFSLSNSAEFVFLNDSMPCADPTGNGGGLFFGGWEDLGTTFSMTISVNSRGTISPPSVTSLFFSAPTNATISAILVAEMSVLQGTIGAVGVDLMSMTFPSFLINGIVEINPSFSFTANAVGFVQLFSIFVPQNVFEYNINNLQFTYPSNIPPATVGVSLEPNKPFILSALSSENSNAQLAMSLNFELLVEVNAFTQFVDLLVSHSIEYDSATNTLPVEDNNVQVCFNNTGRFSLEVSNSGPLFEAFSGANTQTIFEEQNTILLEACQTVALGPSPPTRREMLPLHGRDTFSCAPVAAVPQEGTVFIQEGFP